MDLQDDRQPRPHEPGGGRRHADAARVAQLLRRHLAARLDGPRQLAAAVEARRHGLPRPLRGAATTSRSGSKYRPQEHAVRRSAGATAPTSAGCRTSPTRPRTAASPTRSRATTARSPSSASKTGERTFDYTKEGVAHYGLYADWFEDLRRVGGNALAHDMWDGAEAYLRDVGARRGHPDAALRHLRTAPSPRAASARLRLGATWEALLRRAGQPQQRTRAWSWCVKGKRNRTPRTSPCSSGAGKVELVGQHRARPLGRRHRGRLRRSRPALGNHRSPRRAGHADLRRPPRPGPRRGA